MILYVASAVIAQASFPINVKTRTNVAPPCNNVPGNNRKFGGNYSRSAVVWVDRNNRKFWGQNTIQESCQLCGGLFPTLAAGLLDSKGLCCPRPPRGACLQCSMTKYPCTAQTQSIRAVHNRKVSLRWSTAKNPRSVSLQRPTTKSISAVPKRRAPSHPCSTQPPSIPALLNGNVSLQRATAAYPCSAQTQSIPAQCPTAEYPCSAQPINIPAMPKPTVSLQRSMTKCPCRAQPLQDRTPQHLPLQRQTAIFLKCICNAARKIV